MSRQKPRLRSIFQNRRICEVGAWASQLSRCPRRLEAQEGLPSQEKTAEQNQLRDRSGLTPGSSPGLIWLLPSLAASLPARGSPLRPEGVFERAVSGRGGGGSGQHPRGAEVAAWPGLPGGAAGAQGGLNL